VSTVSNTGQCSRRRGLAWTPALHYQPPDVRRPCPALSTYSRQTRQETAHSQSTVTGETTGGAVRRVMVMAGGRSPIRPSNPFGCARPDAPTLRAPIGQPVASQAVSVVRRPPRCALRSGVAHHHTTFCPTNGSWKKKSLVPPARCTQQIPCITDMPAPPAFRSSQPPVPARGAESPTESAVAGGQARDLRRLSVYGCGVREAKIQRGD